MQTEKIHLPIHNHLHFSYGKLSNKTHSFRISCNTNKVWAKVYFDYLHK